MVMSVAYMTIYILLSKGIANNFFYSISLLFILTLIKYRKINPKSICFYGLTYSNKQIQNFNLYMLQIRDKHVYEAKRSSS